MKKYKIAIIVPSIENDGGVSSVAEFIYNAAYNSSKFEPFIISLSSAAIDKLGISILNPLSWFRGIQSCNGIWRGRPYVEIGAFFSEFEFQRYRKRRILNKFLAEFDLIQVVSGSPALANVAIGLDRPVSLQFATLTMMERRIINSQFRGLIAVWKKIMTVIVGFMERNALKRVDAIQVENLLMLNYVNNINLNTNKKIDTRFATPGVNINIFTPIPTRRLDDDLYILCVARFGDPRKNIDLLLNSYKLLPGYLSKNVRLVLAGATPPNENFWKQSEIFGLRHQITFIDHPSLDALINLYRNASVFVLPSDEEGLGIVILEAMSCGIPVISTRSGGPDGIINDGEDGYLVNINDERSMSSCLEKLLNNHELNYEIGRKARLKIERFYDENKKSKDFVDVWNAIIKKF